MELSNDSLPKSIFNNLISPVSLDVSITMNNFDSYAAFYRNVTNSNLELLIPLGVDEESNGVYLSPNEYLSNGSFNSIKISSNVAYPDNKNAEILIVSTCQHNIILRYKLTQFDGNNFLNQRELRIILVDGSGTVYNPSMVSTQMPDTGQHSEISIVQFISHLIGDIVKIKFSVVQNNANSGASASLLTIFGLNWTISD